MDQVGIGRDSRDSKNLFMCKKIETQIIFIATIPSVLFLIEFSDHFHLAVSCLREVFSH
jgi:hypothetical protein